MGQFSLSHVSIVSTYIVRLVFVYLVNQIHSFARSLITAKRSRDNTNYLGPIHLRINTGEADRFMLAYTRKQHDEIGRRFTRPIGKSVMMM